MDAENHELEKYYTEFRRKQTFSVKINVINQVLSRK